MHMTLIVVGDGDLNEMMNPFWQELEVPEYCVGEVSLNEKQQMLDWYNSKLETSKQYTSFEKCYAEHGKDWNFGAYRKDTDGIWREYSTSNPKMMWDWWEVGGRWPGRLLLKDGVENVHGCHFSWGWTEEDKNKLELRERRTDIARLGDIANLDKLTSYAILINGEWIEISGGLVAPFLEGLPEDTLLTCIDYHM